MDAEIQEATVISEVGGDGGLNQWLEGIWEQMEWI